MALGPLPGTSYSLTRLLGTGGTGEVFEATHDALGKRVAIKLLRPELSEDPELLDRLRAEARILTRITHPALAQVFDLGETADGRLFFAMEYIEGETAASMLARGPLPMARACDIMAEVLDGLAAAHAVGVVHRDIKPSNIIVGADGRARVIDFGVAITDAPAEPELAIGTPSYMAPEQILAHPISFATDLYGVACTLFVLVTGTLPFGSKDVLEKHVSDAPPTLSERLNQPVSTSLEALVAQALAKDPHERPRSASAMAAELRRIARPNDATREVAAPRVSRANVRELPTKFHGRQRELEILSDKFGSGERVVTLLGPGGCGKTRLAKRFAALQIPSYGEAGGVWFVALEDARSESDVVTRVARAIGAPVSSARDEEGALVQLGAFIASRGSMFVVLDNCEQAPAEIARVIARWTEQAPQSRFLATSRERLGLSMEHAFEIEPLLENDAVQLFVDRARLARADYAVADDAPILSEIVRALDGIPLAIELAAARMRMMSASVLRDRLSERFELLASSARDVPARQRTLLAAIDWSWSLLDRVEQSALAQLSVFRGGFTLDAAEAVVDLSAFSESVLDVVQRLRDKSLVYAQGSRDFPSEVRLGLYESIRDFAARKGDVGAARDRHAAYFVRGGADWAMRADIGSAEHLRRLVLEFENLRAVRERALEQNRLRDALSITNTMMIFLSARGAPLTVRIQLADSMIATPGVETEPGLLAGTRYYRAYAQRYVGATDKALEDAKAILELGAKDPMAEFRGHMVLTYFGTAEERIAHGEAAVRTSKGLESYWHQQALNMLAMAHLDAGHHDVVRKMYAELIPLADADGNRKVSAHSRSTLGILLLELGQLEDAERVLEEGLALSPNFGHMEVRRFNLAVVRHERGDYEQAESDYRDVIASAQGNVLASSLAKAALGALLAARDQIDQAAKLLSEAESDLPKTSLYQAAVALHRGHLELACARKAEREGDAESSKRHRLLAERLLEKEVGLEDDVRTARRWLERALHPAAGETVDAWAIASDGSWFRRPHGWRVDVGSRAHAKLVLAALVRARLDPSRPSLTVDDVLQAGWPGERVMRRAAEARVYNIINALRKLGLRDLIVSTDAGYALDPAQRVSAGDVS